MINIRKLEAELWESADLVRQGSKLTNSQYCMPVLALLFLRYAYSRYKMVEAEILQGRPMRGGRVMPVEPSDFAAKSALYLPKEAQSDYLVNLPDHIVSAGLKSKDGHDINSLGEAVNNAMLLVEDPSEQLVGVLLKTYTSFADDLFGELLRILNNKTIDEVGGDVIGRIYEYFLSKFAKAVANDDGVFFTPKSLAKMMVNVWEPKQRMDNQLNTIRQLRLANLPDFPLAEFLSISFTHHIHILEKRKMLANACSTHDFVTITSPLPMTCLLLRNRTSTTIRTRSLTTSLQLSQTTRRHIALFGCSRMSICKISSMWRRPPYRNSRLLPKLMSGEIAV